MKDRVNNILSFWWLCVAAGTNRQVLNRGVPFTGSDLVLDDIGGGNKIYMGDGSRSGASP